MSDAAVGRGLVKSVSSGDTLIVRAIGGGAAPTGPCLPRAAPAAGAPFKAFVPAPEFSLTLAHLQAPRLARALRRLWREESIAREYTDQHTEMRLLDALIEAEKALVAAGLQL